MKFKDTCLPTESTAAANVEDTLSSCACGEVEELQCALCKFALDMHNARTGCVFFRFAVIIIQLRGKVDRRYIHSQHNTPKHRTMLRVDDSLSMPFAKTTYNEPPEESEVLDGL